MVLIVMINLVYWWVPMILILLLVQVEGDAIVQGGGGLEDCMETRCDQNGPAVRFPFRIKGRQPIRCGLPGFDISCSDQNETILVMPSSEGSFVIYDINYKSQGMVGAFQGCLPRDIFHKNGSSPFKFVVPATIFSCPPSIVRDQYSSGLGDDYLLRMYPCHGNNLAGNHYAVIARGLQIDSLPLLSCTKMYDYTSSPEDIYDLCYPCQKLRWSIKSCRHCEEIRKTCGLKIINNFTNDQTHHQIQCLGGKNGIFTGRRGRNRLKILGICGLCFAVIATGMAIYSVYSSNKTEKEIRLRIKTFLDDYKALKPSRYSYADIKRITNQFEENLGQGAYGTVFKGKLSSELLVAVKILNNSNENGEDFINEVGTLCQIHHVNVVRLVGFCADGFIRALVYEFFPKGPLQNFLSSADDKDTFLGWEKLQDIALGIAKGIEYLHQGCDQRILHFDIKPHNVLLDEDFTPKVSDFGLAKFCSKDQSAISMTTARGTMGYIAPEVFSRNFGNVSYKSDVYSFGILLLEMVGGKKNKVTEDNSPTSQFYFPEWIYNLLEQGNDLRIHIGDEGDVGIARKLAIVGLWCIQWHPIDRPSMKVVVQMLEREGDDNLTMPPNPFASASN